MSTRMSRLDPGMRKAPRQARSRATVQAIVQAGARVLGQREWADFTTNEVAAVAGVSIGSLYQYFPNKLALVDAIRRRHFDDVLAVLDRVGEGRATPARIARDLVRGMIAAHGVDPALHRVLLDLPEPGGPDAAHAAFQAEYLRRYRAVVVAYRNRAGEEADGMAAQILSSAVEGVIHNAARRGVLAAPTIERELVRLVCRYLDGGNGDG